MQTLDELLADLKLQYEQEFVIPTIVMVDCYEEDTEIEGCNAYIAVTTPNNRSGRTTLKGMYADIQDGVVHLIVNPGY